MKNPNHPIWATIDTLVIGCLVLGGLWITATNFDASELKAIGIIIGPYIAWKFGEHRLRRDNNTTAPTRNKLTHHSKGR